MAKQPTLFPEMRAAVARVIDKRRWPAGVVPRHLQQWVLIGVAVVMVAILALSGPPAKPRATAAPSSAATAVDPNQQRIEAYQRQIDEQTQRLAAEQASLQATKAAIGAAPATTDARVGVGTVPPRAETAPAARAAAPVEADSREQQARFADNVAYARPTDGPSVVAPALPSVSAPAVAGPPPSLPVPASSAGPAIPLPQAPSVPTAAPVSPAPTTTPSPVAATPRYRLYEGTIIETVLTNRLDGTFTGPVNCLVSVPVYADEHLVVPAGARILGEARAVNAFGQSRLAVTFHRLLLPNGTSVTLDQVQGLNQAGDLGLQDEVNHHYGQIFGMSLALGAIAGFSQANTAVGVDATGTDVYRQGIASSVSQSSTHVLDRFLNLLPTVTIREGHRIKVYLSADLDLPAYVEAPAAPGGRP